MAQAKSNTQTKLDLKADVDSNDEVTQLPTGAASEVTASRPKASKRADGTWLEGLGEGQTWQDVLSTRAFSTEYQNTTSKPIEVSVMMNCISGQNAYIYVSTTSGTGFVAVAKYYEGSASTSGGTVKATVPANHYYKVVPSGAPVLTNWAELR